MKMDNRQKIYLIGSFASFRDRIIDALPDADFADPRNHHQASCTKMVYEDMLEAEECPVALAVFPRGKRGTMSYAELGASAVHRNRIICVDEDTENPDPLLRKISSEYFTSIDDAIDFLKENPGLSAGNRIGNVESRYPAGTSPESVVPMQKIYICGTIDEKIKRAAWAADGISPDKYFIFREDTYEDFRKILDYDLVLAYFSSKEDWDRDACFMMGAAYAHDISILIVDEHEWKYPPLQALARRHTTIEHVVEYLTEVQDLNISREAVNMYNFFKRDMNGKKGR